MFSISRSFRPFCDNSPLFQKISEDYRRAPKTTKEIAEDILRQPKIPEDKSENFPKAAKIWQC